MPPKRLIHAFVPVTTGNEESPSNRRSGESKTPQIVHSNNEPNSAATRKPVPMNCIFALDVSYEAVQSGFLKSACKIILDILYGGGVSLPTTEEEEEDVESETLVDPQILPAWKHGGKVAIVTFDRELCFYDLSVRFYTASSAFRPADFIIPIIPAFYGLSLAGAATSLDNGHARHR